MGRFLLETGHNMYPVSSGLVTATDASVLTSVLNAGRTFTSSAADNATSSASNATLQQHMRALSPAGPAQQTDAMPDSEHDTHAAANDHETVTAKASGTPSDQGKLLPTAIASGEASKIQAVASITASANTMLQPGDAAASEHQLQSAQHAVVEPVTQLPEAHLALCPVTNSMQNASLSSLEPAVTLTCPSAAQPPQDMSDQEVLLPTQGKPVLDVARTNALQSPSQSATPSDATAVRHHADGACGPAVMPVPINAEVAAVSQGPVHLSKAAPSIVSITQPDDSSQRRADTAMGAEPTSALLAMDDKGEVNVKETTAPGMHHLQHIGCDSMLEPIAQDADMLNQADAQGFDMTDQAHAQDVDMAEQSHTCDKAHARRLPGTLATDTGHGAAVPTSLPSSGKPATVSAVPKQASRQLCDQRAVQHSQHSPDRPALHAVAPSVRSQQPTSSTITDAAPHALASQHLQKQPFGAAVMQQQSFPARQHATVATRRQQQDQLQGSQRAVITRHQYQLSDLHKLQRQVASAAVRQNSRWPNAKVTSMSLRSKKRKHSSWSSDQDSIGEERVVTRGSERRKGLGAYATRSRGHVASVVSPELRRTDGRHDRVRWA